MAQKWPAHIVLIVSPAINHAISKPNPLTEKFTVNRDDVSDKNLLKSCRAMVESQQCHINYQ